MDAKFNTNSISISSILGFIESGSIAIPEIQRPFVWKKTQVRDLMDSLYKGYPTGYLIIWNNPDVKLKDGSLSVGKKILIDGQQRVTALMTAIAGKEVMNADFKKERIKIAFDPFAAVSDDADASLVEVQDQSHIKSKRWIADIADVFKNDFASYDFINQYCQDNPDMKPQALSDIITNLSSIKNSQIGVIELSNNIEIDVVTDIFIRINSKGTALSQGDFVMSKIAADEFNDGNTLRKVIDYFAHLCVEPAFYNSIAENDKEFAATEYLQKLKWLKDDNENVYDPDCDDVIRVAFMHMFNRSKLADLVKLLSGRNFETKEYNAEIITDTYEKLREGVLNTTNEYNFKNFMLAIRGAGFKSPKLVRSRMALDFAYTLYLILKKGKSKDTVSDSEAKRIVQKWYVLSVLTGRYSASPESAFYKDLKSIAEYGVVETLKMIESAELSDNFWDIALVQNLDGTSTINPIYLVYQAAQVCNNDLSLFSNNIHVTDLINSGEVHHIFPKAYLKKHGYEKNKYNQIANYVYIDAGINKDISDNVPADYFSDARKQCEDKEQKIGTIFDSDKLKDNLDVNCIPKTVYGMDHESYGDFLVERRQLMAKKIKEYYYSL